MSEQGELWSADPDGWGRDAESRLEYARHRVPDARFVVGDIGELPFGDREFDAVAALNSLLFWGSEAGADWSETARLGSVGVGALRWVLQVKDANGSTSFMITRGA